MTPPRRATGARKPSVPAAGRRRRRTGTVPGVSKFSDAGHVFLPAMTRDPYYPPPLVTKLANQLERLVAFLDERPRPRDEVQIFCDEMTALINTLADEFAEAGSELETVARDDIAVTVIAILALYQIDLDVEDALRDRDW